MKIVYFPIETLTREIDSVLMLSDELLSSAASDYVVTGSALHLKILLRLGLLPKGIWHMKSAQNYTLTLLTKLKRQGFCTTTQNAESLVTFDTKERFDPFAISPKVSHLIDTIFCANDDEYSKLSIAHGAKISDKLCLSGFIRSSMTKSQLETFYSDEIKEIKAEHGQYILYNSTAGLKYHYHSSFDRNSMQGLLLDQGLLPDHVHDLLEWSEQSQATLFAFLEFVRLFTNEHGSKGVKIVFRPHPSEDVSFFTKLFAGHIAVVVDGRYSVIPWMLSSVASIGSSSTTLVEGAALRLPTISFVPEIDSDVMSLLMSNASAKCSILTTTPGELFSEVTQIMMSSESKTNWGDGDLADSLVGKQFDTFSIVSDQIKVLFNHVDRENLKDRLLLFLLPLSIISVGVIIRISISLPGKGSELTYALSKFGGISNALYKKIINFFTATSSEKMVVKLLSNTLLVLKSSDEVNQLKRKTSKSE
ncbi:hypothetical protein N9Y23_02560 [Pseudomonadales bacterium]|nr:hypothetical protein [Pseudomonadales bacterium]